LIHSESGGLKERGQCQFRPVELEGTDACGKGTSGEELFGLKEMFWKEVSVGSCEASVMGPPNYAILERPQANSSCNRTTSFNHDQFNGYYHSLPALRVLNGSMANKGSTSGGKNRKCAWMVILQAEEDG
jgi:hypothetical protein